MVTKGSRKKAKSSKSVSQSEKAEERLERTNIQIKDIDVEKDTKNLIWIIVAIVAVFALFFLIRFLIPSEETLTIDEMHRLNLQGKLHNDTAYVYNGFSFLKMGDLWYTQLQKGNTIFDVTVNYGPKEVED
ncbi:MAG: hypothetical protein KJ574_04225, partial [Nanoarchaeota archaeon]|nr:hypothetical protein [Nanoarchaeota archaeon]